MERHPSFISTGTIHSYTGNAADVLEELADITLQQKIFQPELISQLCLSPLMISEDSLPRLLRTSLSIWPSVAAEKGAA